MEEEITSKDSENMEKILNEEKKICNENLGKIKITPYNGELNIILFNNTINSKA